MSSCLSPRIFLTDFFDCLVVSINVKEKKKPFLG